MFSKSKTSILNRIKEKAKTILSFYYFWNFIKIFALIMIISTLGFNIFLYLL